MNTLKSLVKEIQERKPNSQLEVVNIIRNFTRKNHLPKLPSLAEVSSLLPKKYYEQNKHLFSIKPIRITSGVAVIAVMTAPLACPPQAQCTYCPGGPNSYFGDTPKSYTGNAPASRRAARNKFDPYLQTFNRLEQYSATNKFVDKIEAIVMGGTFPWLPQKYQNDFITSLFQALNDFSSYFYDKEGNFLRHKFMKFFELPSNLDDLERIKRIHKKILKLKKPTTLKNEQLKNETALIRDIALCIETRPDYCYQSHIKNMLRQGTTRIELGIQSIYDDVLKRVRRGHLTDASIKATQLLKDSFLKTGYQIMLGLSDAKKDILMGKEIFSNEKFRPDAIKLYPALVMKGTKLYEEYLAGKYSPIKTEEAIKRINEIKKYIPEYCRVMRIQRDIPSTVVEEGVKTTNLRQLITTKCRCIRCREPRLNEIDFDSVKLKRINYAASNGHEIFLSYEDVKNDFLLGFLRLRIPHKPFISAITPKSAGIRELHVYGQIANIDKKGNIQHKGYGKSLVQEAEKIASEEFDKNKILVISGIGVKEYYKKLGYEKDSYYMSKKLD